MQTPPDLNNQQIWGGRRFRTRSSDDDQTIRTHGAQEEIVEHVPSSQRGILASDSDDLFHPTSGAPLYVLNLPETNMLAPYSRYRRKPGL